MCICKPLTTVLPQHLHLKPSLHIDILYTLDSASNYSAIQKLKP